MNQLITVIGATGNTGKAISEHLLNAGINVKAISRNAEKLLSLKEKGAEVCIGSLEDSDFLNKALQNTKALYAMSPPLYSLDNFKDVLNQISQNISNAIKINKIEYVVMLSSLGADLPSGNGQIACLHEFENTLQGINDCSVVILRSSFYMENHLASIQMIKGAKIFGSIFKENTSIPMIASTDIATTASEYLTNLNFSGFIIHELLGPRNYSFPEIAEILGRAINQPDLKYMKIQKSEFRNGLIGAGFSAHAADAIIEAFEALEEKRITYQSRNKINTTDTTLEEFAKKVFAPAFFAE